MLRLACALGVDGDQQEVGTTAWTRGGDQSPKITRRKIDRNIDTQELVMQVDADIGVWVSQLEFSERRLCCSLRIAQPRIVAKLEQDEYPDGWQVCGGGQLLLTGEGKLQHRGRFEPHSGSAFTSRGIQICQL